MESGDLQMSIQLLLDEAEGEFDDPYALHHRLLETIHTLQAEGLPVPDDLQALKRDLESLMGDPSETLTTPDDNEIEEPTTDGKPV